MSAKHRKQNGEFRPSYVQRLARRIVERAESAKIHADLARQAEEANS